MAVHGYSTRQGSLARPLNWPGEPATPDQRFLADVLAGLRQPHKTLPCKYFYDTLGSRLFDAICETPEYYPTRTELAILRQHAPEMAHRLGAPLQVIEYGSGSSWKTRLLLEHLQRPVQYVPVDIAAEHLAESARRLAEQFPDVPIQPVAADFTRPFQVPSTNFPRAIYFPGSTIGNWIPREANLLLRNMAKLFGPGGALLIGVDIKKDPKILDAAYNDAVGVTAAFNLNLLGRINRELGANFQLNQFRHEAVYNAAFGRVEMHLVSRVEQMVVIAGNVIYFQQGETIHTENSHKYTVGEFAALAERAGLQLETFWLDGQQLFSVQLYRVI